MKISFAINFLAITAISCQLSSRTISSVPVVPIDSLKITITSLNLSEDVSGNDEILILCYLDRDTLTLNETLFQKRLNFPSKNSSRNFSVKLKEDISEKPLLLFVLEQDSDLPIQKIDSILRISHLAIRKQFNARNYTGIEQYLEDEDILGIKAISNLNCAQPYVVNFSGFYKLDKYDYSIQIKCF